MSYRSTWVWAALVVALLAQAANAALVAYWNFDETSGPTAADAVGGFTGTLAGSATFVPAGGIAGGAISLAAATGDLVNMGNVLSFGSGSMSLSVWVKTAGAGEMFPVAKHQSGIENGYFLNINGTGGGGGPGKAMFYLSSISGAPVSTTTVNDNSWHHIIGVFEAGVSRRIYVDGIPVEHTTGSYAMTTDTAPFLVGGLKTGGPTALYTGLVDELRLYDHALSDGQIQALFDCPNGACLCGNSTVEAGEQCDDGNTLDGDCCSSVCALEPSSVVCRPPADVCDVAESCTGSGGTCPADDVLPATTACPTDGNPCTVDACDGSSTACQHPAGNAGSLCRADAGQCDVPEVCDGTSPSCPAEGFEPNGTSCSDANGCTTGEVCTAGACGGGAATVCGLCQQCVPPGGCVNALATGCKLPILPLKASLRVKDGVPDLRDVVEFKWVKGQDITTATEFGDPLGLTDYALCLFDTSTPSPSLLFQGTAPHGGICPTAKPCWKTLGKPAAITGFKYTDRELTPDGTSVVELKMGLLGRSKAIFKGKKDNLLLAPFVSLPLPVQAQIRGTNGACYEATFSAAGMRKNAFGEFKGKAD